MKIAVDFDGTIVDHRFPEIGDVKPFAFEALKALSEQGHQIILWSNREGKHLQDAVEFCRKNGMEFYSVNSDFPNESWSGSGSSRKLLADVYIDDKNLGGLPEWPDIYSMLQGREYTGASYVKKSRKDKKSKSKSRHKGKWNKKFGGIARFFKSISEKCMEARNNYKL